jgi:Papain-like cysteine protease AvrRpt2
MSLNIKNKQDSFAFLDNQIQKFAFETQKQAQQDSEAGFLIPKRRACKISMIDSTNKRQLIENTKFISKSDIIGAPHAMKFLPSPFDRRTKEQMEVDMNDLREFVKMRPYFQYMLKETIEDNEKSANAIGITKDGRHVILQQAAASCVPTSVAMIVLDHGGKPDYNSIKETHFAEDEDAVNWIQKAGFSAKLTLLPHTDKIQTLSKCLKEYGPGALCIYGNDIGGHEIVLDAIEDDMATIRDPFHGWCIDIRLDVLKEIAGSSFIQITGRKTS